MKDLIVKWRIEQVVAAIKYWTIINPPANGLISLQYLLFIRKGTSNIMHALDYYKQEYLKLADVEKSEEMIAEVARRQQEEADKKEQDRSAVDNMSDNDFLANMFSNINKK